MGYGIYEKLIWECMCFRRSLCIYDFMYVCGSLHPSTDGPGNFLLCATFRGLGGVGWGNNVPSTAFFTWRSWLSWLLTFFQLGFGWGGVGQKCSFHYVLHMTFLDFLVVDLLSVHCSFPWRQSSVGNLGKRERLHVEPVVHRKKQQQFTRKIAPRRSVGRYRDDRLLLEKSEGFPIPVGWHASEKGWWPPWTVLQLLHQWAWRQNSTQSDWIFAETPILADCKVTKWVRKNQSILASLLWSKMLQC